MILITGGLGYLGGRIARQLLKEGYQVRIATSRKNALVPEEINECELVQIDLQDSKSLKIASEGISTIIHLAAMNAQACYKDPEQALIINSLGTLNLLKAANENIVSKIFYFSTAHVYGSPLLGDISELSLPQPIHPYSITHRTAEDYVFEYSKDNSLTGVIFRLSNAVGYPLSKDSDCWMLVVNDLVKQVVTNNKIQLRSGGATKRDFLPISDVCTAVSFMLENSQKTSCEIYNIGSGYSMSLNDLAELITERAENILGKRPNIEFLNKENNLEEMSELHYSVEKIISLGCHLENDISEEIDQLLMSCKRWY
jgi:UDP-glucose 4-epimerase